MYTYSLTRSTLNFPIEEQIGKPIKSMHNVRHRIEHPIFTLSSCWACNSPERSYAYYTTHSPGKKDYKSTIHLFGT